MYRIRNSFVAGILFLLNLSKLTSQLRKDQLLSFEFSLVLFGIEILYTLWVCGCLCGNETWYTLCVCVCVCVCVCFISPDTIPSGCLCLKHQLTNWPHLPCNINNLRFICDQTFVSTQYKAKLHQCQRFCILSVVRSHMHCIRNPNTALKMRFCNTQVLWRVGS